MFMLYLKLIRPKHWVKNFIIFAPTVFVPPALESNTFEMWFGSIFAFSCFCICSSSIYVFNDLMDAERDKLDERTNLRPIATKKISRKNGAMLSSVLFIISIILSIFLIPEILNIILSYVIINIMYSIKLKFVQGLDVIIISLGFILRIIAGGLAVSVEQSYWTIIIVAFGSLSLALGKRFGQIQKNYKKITVNWNKKILFLSLSMCIAFTILSYIIFSFDTKVIERHQSNLIWISIPPIIIIFIRYFQLCYNGNFSGDPTEILLKDNIIKFFVFVWILIIFYIFIF